MKPGVVSAAVAVMVGFGSFMTEANAVEKRDCAPNFVASGSMMSGRSFHASKVYRGAKKGPAFDSVVPAVVSTGYQISNSNKDQGLITAQKMSPAAFFGAGGMNSLTVIVAQSGTGIKIETTLTAQGGAGSMGSILDLFCKVFNSVH